MWKIGWGSCVKIAATVLFLFLIIHYWDLLFALLFLFLDASVPLWIGFAIAYVVNILMNYYEKKFLYVVKKEKLRRWRRPVCMTLAFVSVSLLIVFLWHMIIPVLIDCLYTLSQRLPVILDELTGWLRDNSELSCKLLEKLGFMEDDTIDWGAMISSVIETLFHSASSTMESLLNVVIRVITTAVTFLLAAVFAIYVLARKERLKEDGRTLLEKWMGEQAMKRAFYIFDVFNHAFHSFIVGQCLEAVILGVLCIAGMWIFQFPYPVMIGCLVGITALIPLAGAYIGAIVGGLMIFTESPWQTLLFLVFLTFLQQVEGNVIYPRVVGSSMGLPGIWVLAAVIVGGGLAGILGMLIAVPVTAAVYRLFREWLLQDANG